MYEKRKKKTQLSKKDHHKKIHKELQIHNAPTDDVENTQGIN